jgi:hypothetical protein
MNDSRFLVDGRDRALHGAAAEIDRIERPIREAVEARYADRLAQAGPLRRWWLRKLIAREIRARLNEEIEKFAPSDGLYSHVGRQDGSSEKTCNSAPPPKSS